jgi:hypothetical protein
MTREYEFRAYHGDDDCVIDGEAVVTMAKYDETSSAKACAGRIAKRIKGPVDLAFYDDREWPNRYITTAYPSDYHASGYRFERLA